MDDMQKILAKMIMPLLSLSRVRVHTEHTHPELMQAAKALPIEQFAVGIVEGIRPDTLILLSAVAMEEKTNVKVPTGPTAAMIYIAEWLNEHPDIMMEIETDQRWEDTLFIKPAEYMVRHPEIEKYVRNPF